MEVDIAPKNRPELEALIEGRELMAHSADVDHGPWSVTRRSSPAARSRIARSPVSQPVKQRNRPSRATRPEVSTAGDQTSPTVNGSGAAPHSFSRCLG